MSRFDLPGLGWVVLVFLCGAPLLWGPAFVLANVLHAPTTAAPVPAQLANALMLSAPMWVNASVDVMHWTVTWFPTLYASAGFWYLMRGAARVPAVVRLLSTRWRWMAAAAVAAAVAACASFATLAAVHGSLNTDVPAATITLWLLVVVSVSATLGAGVGAASVRHTE